MNRLKVAEYIRVGFAYVLVLLVFTNLFAFFTGLGESDYAAAHANLQHMRNLGIPPYTIRDLGFVVAGLVILLDPSSLRRLVESPLFRWAFCILILYTWAMLHRTMAAPPGMPIYDLMLPYLSRANMLAFMVSCIVIFDGAEVLYKTKWLIVFATLAGVVLNVYDLVYPGTFSEAAGRGAGLFINPNGAGMALVVGCLIGLPVLPRYWRELFVVVSSLGILATFSREAILADIIVIIAAGFARAISLRMLGVGGALAIGLFAAFSIGDVLEHGGILNSDNMSRLTMGTTDNSTAHRLEDAAQTLHAFEDAPLLGQGIGTDEYWSGEPAHNLYLRLMADQGIIGLLIIPALVYSLRRKSWDFYAFAIVFFLWCLFDHFIMTSPFALMCFAVEAGESVQYRQVFPRFARQRFAPLGFSEIDSF
jgi:O-Antigen ligase